MAIVSDIIRTELKKRKDLIIPSHLNTNLNMIMTRYTLLIDILILIQILRQT